MSDFIYNNAHNIMLCILVFVMLLYVPAMVLLIINDATRVQVDTKTLDCYDQLGHKIVGQVCLEKVYCGKIDYFFKIKNCENKK